MAEELKLFTTWSSPYGLRAIYALKIKGVEFETVLEDLKNKSSCLLEYNPVHKKIPVLLHNGLPICESLVILEYIDETWNQRPLLPQDPYERAMARFWARFGDEKVLPSLTRVLISEEKAEREEAIAEVTSNLKLVEEQVRGKKFFGGETIGFLDIALGWIPNRISIVEDVAEVKLVDGVTFPVLWAWMERFAGDPAIKEWWPPRARMLEKFREMRARYLKKPE